jgi:hypothetical protein
MATSAGHEHLKSNGPNRAVANSRVFVFPNDTSSHRTLTSNPVLLPLPHMIPKKLFIPQHDTLLLYGGRVKNPFSSASAGRRDF